jgi:predicted nucleic-acid-binding protein
VTGIDTNVLVRLVTNDDPKQSTRAARLFAEEDIHLSKTVVLETEWVLRAAYGLAPAVIRAAFERLMAVPSITVEDAPAVARAVSWYAAGMDFADALHLASSRPTKVFSTFDKAFVRRAKKLGVTSSITLLRTVEAE